MVRDSRAVPPCGMSEWEANEAKEHEGDFRFRTAEFQTAKDSKNAKEDFGESEFTTKDTEDTEKEKITNAHPSALGADG